LYQVCNKLLRLDEGVSKYLYYDSKGVPTIGVGFNLKQGLRDEEIEFILNNRIALIDSQLSTHPEYDSLSVARKAVIVDMAYNLGVMGCLGFKKMWEALRNKDYETAADEILDSAAAYELPDRYGKLADMMRKG
jgi:lysozyme